MFESDHITLKVRHAPMMSVCRGVVNFEETGSHCIQCLVGQAKWKGSDGNEKCFSLFLDRFI